MSKEEHWQGVYGLKRADEVSWYAERLTSSLASIQAVTKVDAKIIDVGGGASTLADDLLAAGYRGLSVLDISRAGLDAAKDRLGGGAKSVTWIVGDITKVELPCDAYDVWHDRAVFHFLTDVGDRSAYTDRL